MANIQPMSLAIPGEQMPIVVPGDQMPNTQPMSIAVPGDQMTNIQPMSLAITGDQIPNTQTMAFAIRGDQMPNTQPMPLAVPGDKMPNTQPMSIYQIIIPTVSINVFEPDDDNPLPPEIIHEREIDLETTNIQREVLYNTNLLSPAYWYDPITSETPVIFRNYAIKDSDGIQDTYLQPFKIDETEDGDLWCRGSSVSSDNQSEDDEEHKEQCDKLLKFEQEFGLPSICQPVTESSPSRRIGVDHSYTEKDFSRHRKSSTLASGPIIKPHKRHHHHHHHRKHKTHRDIINEDDFKSSKETDLTGGLNVSIVPITDKEKLGGNLKSFDESTTRSQSQLPLSDTFEDSSKKLRTLSISDSRLLRLPSISRSPKPPRRQAEEKEAEVDQKEPDGDIKETSEKEHRKEHRKHDKHRHHHRHRHHRYRHHRAEKGATLESRIMSELEELEEESKAIREIATGINEEIKGHHDPNEVADITSHRMDNIHNIRHITSVRPSRRAMRRMTDADSVVSFKASQMNLDIESEQIDPVNTEANIPEGFVELEELTENTENTDHHWKQRARWIKFEESVEKNERWGKPHVASLSFHSLLELRRGIENGSVLLSLDNFDLPTICETVADNMVISDQINDSVRDRVLDILLSQHCHHHQKVGMMRARRPSLAGGRRPSFVELTSSLIKGDSSPTDSAIYTASSARENERVELMENSYASEGKSLLDGKIARDSFVIDNVDALKQKDENVEGFGGKEDNYNDKYRSPAVRFAPVTATEHPKTPINAIFTESDVKARIPAGAEATSVLVGTMEELDRMSVAFVRLSQGSLLGNLTEVPIPVRFLFIILGPPSNHNYYEIGRSFATLMSDKVFHDLAYTAKNRDDILAAINSFLDDSIVLSPGDWDRHLLLPLLKAEITARKKERIKLMKEKAHEDVPKDLQPFLRTGKPFGGLVRDIKRKYKYYTSDIKDAFNARCLVSIIFIFFATLAPTLSFGALLMKKTDDALGVLETLLATSVCGIIFSLTAGQPLIIVGTTGPILVFEEVVHTLSKSLDGVGIENYLRWRLWIGLLVMIILWIIVALEGCYLVEYFTRFTEEVFSVLISALFVYEAVTFVFKTFKKYPIQHGKYDITTNLTVGPGYGNSSDKFFCTQNHYSHHYHNTTDYTKVSCIVSCDSTNVGLISSLLVVGTFFISYYLRKLRFSNFLSSKARRVLSDFGVPIAMISMVAVNFAIDVNVPMLKLPHQFEPTLKSRERFLVYDFWKVPVEWLFVGIIPAFCVSILLFMETELTGVLLNKSANQLKKGGGYNIDLFIMGLCTGICSLLGLPWMCPGPVRSVQHQKALMVMSRTHAPGEKPYLLHIKEQRLTNLVIHVLMGFCMLAFDLIESIPLAVCYGVFLYLGISSLSGIQFMEQIKLVFVPMKYHPNKKYVQNVKFSTLLSYTGIQVICFCILVALKLTAGAPGFPFFLIAMVFIRKAMARYFDEAELEDLDNEEDEQEFDIDDEYSTALPM